MKKIPLLVLAFSSLTNAATIGIEPFFGIGYDFSGDAVVDGRLWIMMASADNDFAGGFSVDSSLGLAGSVNSDFFTGQTLSIGDTIAGDTIFAMGAFNGASQSLGSGVVSGPAASYETGINGVISGDVYAFYWFSDVVFTGSGTEVVGTEIGGINKITDDSSTSFTEVMIFQDSGNVIAGAQTSDFSGSFSNAAFTAVQIIPEPSSMLLSLAGLSLTLRRKR